MKYFLFKILFLFAIIASFLIIGELFVRSLQNPYKYKDKWMNKKAYSLETLILGTSQSEMGINPHVIDNSFNLAFTSGTLEYDLFLLKKYSSQYKNLKNVIIELSYYNLYATEFEEQPDNIHNAMFYRVYMGYPKHPISPLYNFEFANLDYFNFHINVGIDYYLKGTPLPDMCDSLGWVENNRCVEIENYNEYVTDMKKTIKVLNSFSINNKSKNIKYIDEIVTYCTKNDITPYIVILPLSFAITNRLDKRKLSDLRKTETHYQKSGIKVLDYLNHPLFRKEDFLNSNHLNNKGADKLTRMINKELNLLKFRK